MIAPPLRNLDFSVLKNFPITERFQLQYRGEFFNILNHLNFGPPDMNISNVTARVISQAYDGPSIQLVRFTAQSARWRKVEAIDS